MATVCRTLVVGLVMLASLLPAGADGPDAAEILKKTLEAYSKAKTYDARWSYITTRGTDTQKLQIEVKSKSPTRLLFKVAAAPGAKPSPRDTVPEMLVVIDGTTAWFQNTSEKTYFKVPLPKEPRFSPLMFFPQIEANSEVQRKDDLSVDGKTVYVVEAERAQGGVTRMEIDASTFRIRKIVTEISMAFIRTVSTIAIEQETFDGEIPDKVFTFKAARGLKQIDAPVGAGAMFGTGG